jgi:predicted permease
MQTLLQDIRYGLRMLRKQPAFTAVAVITLALGIGANTAIFSVVHAVLLQPLPFGQPERLVQIWESRVERGWNRASFTEANFWDIRELNRSFEDIATFHGANVNLTGLEYPERLRAGQISAGFFRVLRVQPVLGRTFQPGEDEPEADSRLVLLGNDFWRRRFGGDSAIVGTSLTLDDEGYTVVGVLPAGEPWLNFADVYVPFVRDPEANRVSFEFAVIGRMMPGISMEAALSDLESVARGLEELYPEENAGMGITIAPASDWVADDDLRRALWVLFGAVGFLLMIACVNLANMLLARATARMRETAVRAALGAGRFRIIRQVLTESLVLGLIGAGLGLLLAVWGIDVLRALDPPGIPRVAEIGVNRWVLGFTLGIGLFTGVAAGLLPALNMPRTDFVSALREGDRSMVGNRAQKRLRGLLVAAEVALSLMLLVGAGLLVRSFSELSRVERGFQSENRLIAAVNLPGSYDGLRTRDFMVSFLARAHSIQQVQSAAAVSSRLIVGGNTGLGILAAGRPEDPDQDVPWATWRLATGEYFRTVGLPLLRGRTFTERDEIDWGDPFSRPLRVVISQRLGELLYPGEDPLGREVILWSGQGDLPAEVIGVVGNMRERGLDVDPTLAVYLPYYGSSFSPINFVFHTGSDPTSIVPAVRSILAELDPSLPLSNIRTVDEVVGDSIAARRFNVLLLAIFAGVALLLALAGIYGVQSYSVARRTSEIGIRVAIGASPDRVLKQIVSQGMRPAIVGIVLGLAGALALSRVMASLLFGIAPQDPITYVVVAFLLAAAALISCYLPALRALRVDPVTALRQE